MIECEGYKAFRGTMLIVPLTDVEPYEVSGDWLYKPDTDCWYCKGRSYPEEICYVDALDQIGLVHARWEKRNYGGLACSACGRGNVGFARRRFCPDCGASMDGKEPDSDAETIR